MPVFTYPLNPTDIIKNKKKYIKDFLLNDNITTKKIALLGGSTTADLKANLELFLLSKGINPEFYESDYNQYFEDIMFSDKIKNFDPDITIIATSHHNLQIKETFFNSNEDINHGIQNEFKKFKTMWEKLQEDTQSIIIQNNFDLPITRSLQQFDAYPGGISHAVLKLNILFTEHAHSNKRLFIHDYHYLTSYHGVQNWTDNTFWYAYKYPNNVDMTPFYANNICNIIAALFGKSKKCLVLDLDNTLWGGIIGDDGVDNLELGLETALGEAYYYFQLYIKSLKERGIILAICSKNELSSAKIGLSHPNSVLKESDFSLIKANWEPKDQNILAISKELNIGLDSLVFIDDNPAERDLIQQSLPEVTVPNIGSDPCDFKTHLDHAGYFETVGISDDDKKRTTLYKENIKRESQQSAFTNYDDYLKSLCMKAEIDNFKPIYLDRITQLINKTNQFNLTTQRLTSQEVETIASSSDHIAVYGKLKDKFGDNGLVSVMIGKIQDDTCHIYIWLMSCRVFKRTFEYAMFSNFVEKCQEKGVKKITGAYIKTQKNGIIKDLLKDVGFSKNNNEAQSTWYYKINKKKLNSHQFRGEI